MAVKDFDLFKKEMRHRELSAFSLFDDELSIAKMGTAILGRLGYAVTTSTSSEEALAMFRMNPMNFDLVITDMTMPKMTGDKLAREIMNLRPDIPVILCTGYNKQISDEDISKIGIKGICPQTVYKGGSGQNRQKSAEWGKELLSPKGFSVTMTLPAVCRKMQPVDLLPGRGTRRSN